MYSSVKNNDVAVDCDLKYYKTNQNPIKKSLTFSKVAEGDILRDKKNIG